MQVVNGAKFFIRLFQPLYFFGRDGPFDLLHVIGVINFVGIDIALSRQRGVHAVSAKQHQKHKGPVHDKQFIQLGAKHRGGVKLCFAALRQYQPVHCQQLRAGKQHTKARHKRRKGHCRCHTLYQHQRHRLAKPVQVSVPANQLVGAQQADEVCVFQHVQPAGGGDDAADEQIGTQQRQCAKVAGKGAAGSQHGQHHPHARHKGGAPLCQ
ncbi:hypothetical protein SDC9_145191 [bioreactor metagenome]|uniref:Uncharacterized protein n=1 Tax=bioreactor metagenome TaxID=1076179 RepID=A0A645E8A7_9ZZZZ